MVLVGAQGRSAVVRPEEAGLLDSFFDFGSTFNRPAPAKAQPRGGFVLVYLLGPGGLPGVPGRFYPRTRAGCFSWDTGRVGRPCYAVNRALLAALRPSRRLPLIAGAPTVLAELARPDGSPVFAGSEPLAWANATVAIEMAFGRWRVARRLQERAKNCVALRGRWTGPDRSRRPTQFCLAPAGVWAAGRLYPLRRGVWEFVRVNSR
jgi:hypothetical protein